MKIKQTAYHSFIFILRLKIFYVYFAYIYICARMDKVPTEARKGCFIPQN